MTSTSSRLSLSGLIVTLFLAGCASSGKPVAPTTLEPAAVTLEQMMSDAARLRQEGARNAERDAYRNAARSFPTSKAPWLKLAESYFEGADYGNAILAAQEVLQRDSNDNLATSILAVSGLRVSTAALTALRQQKDLSADTRSQAEQVVKSLREVLGEQVLVPKPQEGHRAAAPAPRRAAPVAAKPRPAAPAAPKPAAAAANPFDQLK